MSGCDLGQHRPEKFSSRYWIKRGAISCSPHTSFRRNQINDSVVNSERGKFVRGSDSPLVYNAHSTAGDLVEGADQASVKTHIRRLVCKNLKQKIFIVSRRAKKRISRGCDGRPQDNTSNLSRPRAWIEMKASELSPTLMWPCAERKRVTMGCLHVEIEGQSCFEVSVDQGLMTNRQIDLLDRMT